MNNCKDCNQEIIKCICDQVDDFFEECWDLMRDDSWIVSKMVKNKEVNEWLD